MTHQGFEDQAQVVTVVEGAKQTNNVILASRVGTSQLFEDHNLCLASLRHDIICTNDLDGDLWVGHTHDLLTR